MAHLLVHKMCFVDESEYERQPSGCSGACAVLLECLRYQGGRLLGQACSPDGPMPHGWCYSCLSCSAESLESLQNTST